MFSWNELWRKCFFNRNKFYRILDKFEMLVLSPANRCWAVLSCGHVTSKHYHFFREAIWQRFEMTSVDTNPRHRGWISVLHLHLKICGSSPNDMPIPCGCLHVYPLGDLPITLEYHLDSMDCCQNRIRILILASQIKTPLEKNMS